ncbi:hypothetical protein NSE01_32220 [Novosphingobium sediminis]|uniref:Uncharacterized protein n=1 Tax=Novosphingobium sediminis TaxID=707214 RepID=A0A512ANV3_9SPHN|nr:hypothetical protein NSE01_32220 [Novosphingobium sediminis]
MLAAHRKLEPHAPRAPVVEMLHSLELVEHGLLLPLAFTTCIQNGRNRPRFRAYALIPLGFAV